MSFDAHVEKLYRKSLSFLEFIKRTCHDFNDPLCIKVLYCALVRFSLEFGTVIWNPHQTCLINNLEKVQRSFLRFYAYKTKLFNHNINGIANFAGLKSLETRPLVFNITFLHKIMNSDIDCPEF